MSDSVKFEERFENYLSSEGELSQQWLNDRRTLANAEDGTWVELGKPSDSGVVDGVLGVAQSDLRYACESTKSFDAFKNAPKAYSALEKVLAICDKIDAKEGKSKSTHDIRQAIEESLLNDE